MHTRINNLYSNNHIIIYYDITYNKKTLEETGEDSGGGNHLSKIACLRLLV